MMGLSFKFLCPGWGVVFIAILVLKENGSSGAASVYQSALLSELSFPDLMAVWYKDS